jgi:hypothetical protein
MYPVVQVGLIFVGCRTPTETPGGEPRDTLVFMMTQAMFSTSTTLHQHP